MATSGSRSGKTFQNRLLFAGNTTFPGDQGAEVLKVQQELKAELDSVLTADIPLALAEWPIVITDYTPPAAV